MKEYSNSENDQIKDEMNYRLLKGNHIEGITYPVAVQERSVFEKIKHWIKLQIGL